MIESNKKIMLVAGEASGDQHAANLFLELKKKEIDITAIGMGGKKMADAGIKLAYDSSHIAVIGVMEVLQHYVEIRRALICMKKLLLDEQPDLLICVDYKEFNFKLASFAKKKGVKVLFYISPQIWAWRENRVVKYGKIIDMMAVIFPFEVAYYEREHVPVRYVGHPSVDKVKPKHSKARDLHEFALNSRLPIVGLLPGSRTDEIQRMLPVMLEAAERILLLMPDTQFLLPQAENVSDELLEGLLNHSVANVKRIKNQFYDAVQCCDVVMTVSGTATLEISLLAVPMLVTYKLSTLTYLLAKILVKTHFIGLPNIIAGKGVVKEFIQAEATADNLSLEVFRILQDETYAEEMRRQLLFVKESVGKGGGSENMAQLVLEMLSN